LREKREEQLDPKMLDDVHRRNAADRAGGDSVETLRHSGYDRVDATRTKIRNRPLVRIKTARCDACVTTRNEQLATSAADVEQRLVSARIVNIRTNCFEHLGFAAAHSVLEPAIQKIRRRRR